MLSARDSKPRALLIVVASLLAAGSIAACGDGPEAAEPSPASTPLSLIQTARSGSFLGSGSSQRLVLRGVGGAVALSAEGSGGGGSAGAIATGALVRRAHRILGPEPFGATLSGAEVIPQRYRLELSRPRYDGVRQELSFDAEVASGSPELPPPSFGAATLTIASSLPSYVLSGDVAALEPGLAQQPGEPLAGALVTVGIGGLGLVTASSDADGSFSVGPLPAGAYTVKATRSGFASDRAERTLPPGSEPLELELIAEQQARQSG